jgi:di/tripeptidase
MYPCEISQSGVLFEAITQSLRRAGREAPGILYSHGALDAGFLGVNGCDAAMWGPGRMEQFHSDDEMLLVSELEASAADYLGLIRHWLH